MKNVVLQPSFYKNFECIGGKCVNNCCRHRWKIDFTKEEFKNIKRKIHTEEFKKLYEDAFIYDKKIGKYFIKIDDDNRCKFLNENGLCGIYTEVGPENMSQICKIFPRRGMYYIKEYEYFLSVGCEEVVRLLIEEKDGIQLEWIERELTDAEKKGAAICSAAYVNERPMLYYYNDVKKLLFGVLQNRMYDFGERMVVLGIALKKVDEMGKNGQIDKIPEYIENFILEFYDEKNKEMYTNLFEKVDRSGKKRAVQVLTYFIIINNKELYEKMQERINYTMTIDMRKVKKSEKGQEVEKDMKFDIEKYQKAIQDFEQFLKGKEYWIENVMLEGFLNARIPFWINGGIWKNYCAMAIIYSIFLFYLTCLLEKDSTKEDFMDYVSKISRWTFHNEPFMKQMEERLEQTESNTLAHMAMLVL